MNTFDNFRLCGANINRYVPILSDASKMVGAYRKLAEVVETGKVPLFLLDGVITQENLAKAIEKAGLTAFVAICRTCDNKAKKELENLYKMMRSRGLLNKDGMACEWLSREVRKCDTLTGETKQALAETIADYLIFEKAQDKYVKEAATIPIDATTGNRIDGDLNEYLFDVAKEMFPFGIESILEDNTKQSEIANTRFFMDGIQRKPPPKGVRCNDWEQMSFFDTRGTDVNDSIAKLREFVNRQVKETGAVTVVEMLQRCADMGLYISNTTLYALGSALRDMDKQDAVFYDGIVCRRFSKVKDVGSLVLKVHKEMQPRMIKGKLTVPRRSVHSSCFFIDNSTLKDRLRWIFGLSPPGGRPELDTLGVAVSQMGQWVVDNLRYPIAFLDEKLNQIYRENKLCGKAIQPFDTHFNQERCEWIREQLPHADEMARRAIEKVVGFDPDLQKHPLSTLPRGHYAPIMWSAEEYLEEIKGGNGREKSV